MRRILQQACVLAASALAGGAACADAQDGPVHFEKHIRPLLEKRCYECHSHGAKIKGGLVLDSKSGWQQGGDSGPAIVPGRPEESRLITAVRYTDPDLQMPPKQKLTDAERALLEQWVAMGAPDPREGLTATKDKGMSMEDRLKHWAFQPIHASSHGSVDTFVSAGPEADRYTLLRRVSFDLTGLPPSRGQIEAFVNDAAPDAFARVVDRLLQSPAYGERWARHWLDLVGYADQLGTGNNVPAVHAWRYRDYVIRAFNADKPFDAFIREQIAGDLMPVSSIAQRRDRLEATGFLLLGNISIIEADKDKLRVDVVDQQIEKVGKAFLGMTLNCVRCHDHKFDPVTLQDYYALAGIFMNAESVYWTKRGVWSSLTTAELPETDAEQRQRDAASRQHEQTCIRIKAEREEAKRCSGELAARIEAESDKAKREPLEKEKADADKKARDLDNRLLHLDYIRPVVPVAYAPNEVKKATDTRITIRGNAHALGDSVPRGFVKAAFTGTPPAIPGGQSGRVQLADWLTSPHNLLTSRVTVNRIWQKLFGEGIMRSVDYFGLRGGQPSNPALLDHLALRFMKQGWSQKKLIREIVLSAAYRQTSGTLQQHFRLDAEAIRDAVLATSGSLVSCKGGPALALEYPENVSGLDPKNVNPVAFSVTKFRPEQASLRTIYLPVLRSSVQKGPSEILDVFDFAQPAQVQGQRAITTVPPQALFLMNGPLLKNQAGGLADDLLKSTTPDDAVRLADLYLRVLNRPITADESREALAFLSTFDTPIAATDELPQRRHLAWTSLCHALFTCNEFLFRL